MCSAGWQKNPCCGILMPPGPSAPRSCSSTVDGTVWDRDIVPTPICFGSSMPIINRIAKFHDEITAWRRDLHAHPEVLFDVHRTAGFVAEKLREFGCDEVVTGIGRTGVVAIINGRGGPGKTIGLRAD